MDGWTGRWIDRRMDGPTDVWTQRWMDRQTEGKINLYTDKQTEHTCGWLVIGLPIKQ